MAMTREILSQLENHVILPIKTRIANLLARAVVSLVDDQTKMQTVQLGVLADEPRTGERFQNYGLSSVPLPGAEAAVIFPNGDRGHAIILAVDDRRYRPRGSQPGEVVLYTDEGVGVKLARGGFVLLGSDAASAPVTLATEIAALKAAVAAWSGGGTSDGGVSLKAVFAAWSAPGASKVKAQ